MNLVLTRFQWGADGIFGQLKTNDNASDLIAMTLERAYPMTDQLNGHSVYAKIPQGDYICERGVHQLEHGGPFETFEVTGVTGHTNLLFHKGNYDSDSQGCILLGMSMAQVTPDTQMVTDSKDAFEGFMELQTGQETFVLSVLG
jgi:uncharacterized protein DUF5675